MNCPESVGLGSPTQRIASILLVETLFTIAHCMALHITLAEKLDQLIYDTIVMPRCCVFNLYRSRTRDPTVANAQMLTASLPTPMFWNGYSRYSRFPTGIR